MDEKDRADAFTTVSPSFADPAVTDSHRLLAEGLPATSFAYPFGSFDSGTELVVHDCGYNSGRGVSGVTKNGPYAETIPPLDPYATRTPPNPKKATKLSTLELYVQNG